MSPRGSQQRPTLTKIDQRVPASDAQARLQERVDGWRPTPAPVRKNGWAIRRRIDRRWRRAVG